MTVLGAPGVRVERVELLANDFAELITRARDHGMTELELAAAVGAVIGTLAGTEAGLQDFVGYARKYLPQ